MFFVYTNLRCQKPVGEKVQYAFKTRLVHKNLITNNTLNARYFCRAFLFVDRMIQLITDNSFTILEGRSSP